MRQLAAAVLIVPALALAAATPQVVVHTGRLLDASDKPSLAGLHALTFSLFADAHFSGTGAETPIWTETYKLQISQTGTYQVVLGGNADDGGASNKKGFDAQTFVAGQDRFLEIAVEGEALSPRLQVGSVPFAFVAGDASTLGGKAPSTYASAADLQTAAAAAGTALSGAQQTLTTNIAAVQANVASLQTDEATRLQGVTAAAPLTVDNTNATLPAIGLGKADAAHDGFVAQADFGKFANKAEKTGEAGYLQNNPPSGHVAQNGGFNLTGDGNLSGLLTVDGNLLLAGTTKWGLEASEGPAFQIIDRTNNIRRGVFDTAGNVWLGGGMDNAAGSKAVLSVLKDGNVAVKGNLTVGGTITGATRFGDIGGGEVWNVGDFVADAWCGSIGGYTSNTHAIPITPAMLSAGSSCNTICSNVASAVGGGASCLRGPTRISPGQNSRYASFYWYYDCAHAAAANGPTYCCCLFN